MTSKLLLASNSPRRRQLLSLTGWPFSIRAVPIDERPFTDEQPADYVLRLAESKARAVAALAEPGDIILAADTTVADGSRILGKPGEPAEAWEMLRSLRGRAHLVYTAICVFDPQSARLMNDLSVARVWMRDYSDADIAAYIASGDPFDKAGAYAIQNTEFHPVERIEGCYNCVVGLPLCRVVQTVSRFGLIPPNAITAGCPTHLDTAPCLAYEALLRIESSENGSVHAENPDRS